MVRELVYTYEAEVFLQFDGNLVHGGNAYCSAVPGQDIVGEGLPRRERKRVLLLKKTSI